MSAFNYNKADEDQLRKQRVKKQKKLVTINVKKVKSNNQKWVTEISSAPRHQLADGHINGKIKIGGNLLQLRPVILTLTSPGKIIIKSPLTS